MPLLTAVRRGAVETIQRLLRAKADANQAHSFDGETLLYTAADNNQVTAIELLLMAKADVNQTELQQWASWAKKKFKMVR